MTVNFTIVKFCVAKLQYFTDSKEYRPKNLTYLTQSFNMANNFLYT